MSTETRVLFWAPSLSGDTRIQTALEIASGRLDASVFGDQLVDAVATLAAHLLLTNPSTGDGMTRGPVTSEKSGGESVSYGTITAAGLSLEEVALSRTGPGLQFLQIRDSRAGIGPMVLL